MQIKCNPVFNSKAELFYISLLVSPLLFEGFCLQGFQVSTYLPFTISRLHSNLRQPNPDVLIKSANFLQNQISQRSIITRSGTDQIVSDVLSKVQRFRPLEPLFYKMLRGNCPTFDLAIISQMCICVIQRTNAHMICMCICLSFRI